MSRLIAASKYCESIFDGTHETPKAVIKGQLLITSKHISGGTLDTSTAYMISDEDYVSIQRRSAVSQWDILFSMIGSVGEVYLEKNTRISYAIKNMGVFSCKNENKSKWLYYYLRSPAAKSHISRYLNGAVQKFLPLGALREFPVVPFDGQKISLVKALETLDAKIECNNRINAELEAMAKTLYDYWFVQFDFTDKNGRPYKSSGGKMVYNPTLKRKTPEGWVAEELGNVVKTSLGGTPATKNKDYWENANIAWLSSAEIAQFPVVESDQHITQKGIENSAALLLPRGSVVISIVRYIRPSILAIDSATNQSVVGILESNNLKKSFIYPFICGEVPRLMGLRTGAQQPHINKATIDETLTVIPPDAVLEEYYKTAEPIFNLIMKHAFENQQLTQLRDWLLPMLMNGQVTVM